MRTGDIYVGDPTITKISAKASIKYDLWQASGEPLTGKYKIKCISAQNQASYTSALSSSASAYDVQYRIHHDCHKMYQKVEVWEQHGDYRHRSNGFRFRIRFLGTNDNPGQYEVVSDDTTPLKAGEATLDFVAKTIVEGGKNLFYDAIPFENLKTYEEMP